MNFEPRTLIEFRMNALSSQHLQRDRKYLETLYASTEIIHSTSELQQTLDWLVRAAADATRCRACSIRLLDETGTWLYVSAVYGLSDAYIRKGDLVLERNPLAREVLSGKIINIGYVTTDGRLQYPAEAIAEGIYSMLSARLMGNRGPWGLIRAYGAERNHFTEADATFLTALASLCSIAIEKTMAQQALGTLDDMKSKFVLTVTHELRSPVSVTRSLLRTMMSGYAGTMSEEQRDIVTRALRRVDFLQTLIDDLLDLAAGKSELGMKEERIEVSLGDAVEEVVKRFNVPAQEKEIGLEYHYTPEEQPLQVLATREGMDRILSNLVSNAVKYTPHGGHVSVTLGRAGTEAHLEIVDTGIGIPEDALPHLFEEFYRAPNAKAVEKEGTGLGLALTKDLVTRYGGRISVKSQIGHGTTFAVVFPLAR